MVDRINSMGDSEFGLNRETARRMRTTRELDLSTLQDNDLSSRAYTLEDLMSGSTFTATTETLPSTTGATELALNYDDMHSLAFFASVYTRVNIALNRIQDEYPNGFLISQIITGAT